MSNKPHLSLRPYIHTSPPIPRYEDMQTGWIYRYYDEYGRLLYIGQTSSDAGRNRWYKHREEEYARWAPQVERVFVVPCYGSAPLWHEARAIASEDPFYNRSDRPYEDIDAPRSAPIPLQTFMAVCLHQGLEWIPGWWQHKPSQVLDDPWIGDGRDWGERGGKSRVPEGDPLAGFSEYSRDLYVSAMSLLPPEVVTQGVVPVLIPA